MLQLHQTTAKLVHVRYRIHTLLTTLHSPAANQGASGSSSVGAGESDESDDRQGGGAREYLETEAHSVLSDLGDALSLVGEVQSAHALHGAASKGKRRWPGRSADGCGTGSAEEGGGGDGTRGRETGETSSVSDIPGQARKYTYEELEEKLVELKDALFLEREWNQRREAAFKDHTAQQNQRAHAGARAAGAPESTGAGLAQNCGGVVPSLARNMHKVSGLAGQGPEAMVAKDVESRMRKLSEVAVDTSAEYDETTDVDTHQDLSHAEGDDESPLPRLSRNSSQMERLSVSFGPRGLPLTEDLSSVEELQRELAALRRALEEETKLSEWYASQLDEANRQVCLSSYLCLCACTRVLISPPLGPHAGGCSGFGRQCAGECAGGGCARRCLQGASCYARSCAQVSEPRDRCPEGGG